MLTIAKSKIGVTPLVLASFVLGAVMFTAYQAEASGGFHRFGFLGGGCDLSGLERGTPEWQAKVDECKEDKGAQREEFKAMTPEERQAKLEELKANLPEGKTFKGHGFGFLGCDLTDLEKDSPEWQTKSDECKAERQEKMEERKAEMEALKNMTPEERKAKMEELKASGEWTGFGNRSGHFNHFKGLKGRPAKSN